MKTPINFAVFRESRDQPDFEDDLNTLSDSVNKFFTRLSPIFSGEPDEGGHWAGPAVAEKGCRIEAVNSVFQSVKKRKGEIPRTTCKVSFSVRIRGFIWWTKKAKQSSLHLNPTVLSHLILDTSGTGKVIAELPNLANGMLPWRQL
jgi:hypothetical protein